jgi:hypothetical protein
MLLELPPIPARSSWEWLGTGGLPEHAPLARRLGDDVGDDGVRLAPRRLMLASVFGQPALVWLKVEPGLLVLGGWRMLTAANKSPERQRRDLDSAERLQSRRPWW